MNKILVSLTLSGLFGLATHAFAQDMKVGVVDLQKIVQTSAQMQAIQKRLETDFRPRRDALVAEEKTLREKMDAFKRDAVVMNTTTKKDKERELVALQQKFERAGQQYQQELNTAHNQSMEDFYTKVRASIASVAKKEKYDLVLQKDAAPFAAEKLDVTKLVISDIK